MAKQGKSQLSQAFYTQSQARRVIGVMGENYISRIFRSNLVTVIPFGKYRVISRADMQRIIDLIETDYNKILTIARGNDE